MKKGRRKRKKRVHIIGEIGIVSILLAVVFILIENFCIDDKKNISKADYSKVKIGDTNFGDDYGLHTVSATEVNNMATGQKIMTVSSSFYNYRYDNEIKKGWRDQGIDGELSGVANPFSVFNNKLSTYYASSNTSLYGLYEGNFYNHWTGSYNAKNYNWCLKNYTGFSWAQNIANRGTYSAVCQGLVGNSLVGYEWTGSNFKAGNIMCSDGTTILPFFNKEFLEQKYTNNDTVGIGVVAE